MPIIKVTEIFTGKFKFVFKSRSSREEKEERKINKMEIGPPKNRSNRRIKIHKRENDLKRFQNGTFLTEMRKITKFALRARFLQKWLVFARNMLKRLRQIFDETIFSTEGDLDRSYREFPDPQRGYYAFMFHTEWASGLLQEKFRKKLM